MKMLHLNQADFPISYNGVDESREQLLISPLCSTAVI